MSVMNAEEIEIDLLHPDRNEQNRKPPKRTVWTRKSEYLLSLIGYTVGLSSLWRFSYLCMKNDGGAFLIPFTFFMIICGFPLYYLELALGQFSGKSPMSVWNICPLFKGIGYTMVALSLIVTWYYGTVIAWALYYLGHSFSRTLPWSTCDNDWNTEHCVVLIGDGVQRPRTQNINITNTSNITVNGSSSLVNDTMSFTTAASEFWRYKVLNISDGIDDWGSLQRPLVLVMFLSTAMCFLCIVKGVRSIGKVVWVTALMPYFFLTVILVRSLTLDGAIDGIIYYVKPDFRRLLHFQVIWYHYTAALGPQGSLQMSEIHICYNCILIWVTALISIHCALIHISIAYVHFRHLMMSDIENIVCMTSPGLVFHTYPEALTRLPLPQLWCALFFVLVCFVGVDSQFGMLETVVSGVADVFPHTLGKRKILIVGCAFLLYLVSSLEGLYIFMFVDWYASAYCIFFTSLLECVVIGWCYGAEGFSRDVEVMTGMPVYPVIRWSWCIFAMSVALGMAITNMSNPVHKGYIYPDYKGYVGNLVGLIPILPIPIVMATEVLKARRTLFQRIKVLLRPNRDWLPNDAEARGKYKMYEFGARFGL
ncbi:Sodium- and chloride-dependent GABA transporter 3 [Mizuhopecten yessoensis]|uniref:Sodium-and chloride-dependent GABA transporter 3 n=1 Tax=Mizuhopecten yessoensis TaxID=6573 RepID=A0A210PZ97_MIZYE|nr:Sodium- and chloride-dependent GABA transporter 3 [Mizuhopecten yessoensis]